MEIHRRFWLIKISSSCKFIEKHKFLRYFNSFVVHIDFLAWKFIMAVLVLKDNLFEDENDGMINLSLT